MPTKSCLTCGYRTLNPSQCPLIGYQYAEDRNQVCPYWAEELPTCEVCGQIDPTYALTQKNDGTWVRLCKNCMSKSGTCGMCKNGTECDFETNPSTLPKAVQKTIQQGPMTTVTNIPNPSRVEITCRVNCQCFSEEFGCLRQNSTCGKYEGVF